MMQASASESSTNLTESDLTSLLYKLQQQLELQSKGTFGLERDATVASVTHASNNTNDDNVSISTSTNRSSFSRPKSTSLYNLNQISLTDNVKDLIHHQYSPPSVNTNLSQSQTDLAEDEARDIWPSSSTTRSPKCIQASGSTRGSTSISHYSIPTSADLGAIVAENPRSYRRFVRNNNPEFSFESFLTKQRQALQYRKQLDEQVEAKQRQQQKNVVLDLIREKLLDTKVAQQQKTLFDEYQKEHLNLNNKKFNESHSSVNHNEQIIFDESISSRPPSSTTTLPPLSLKNNWPNYGENHHHHNRTTTTTNNLQSSQRLAVPSRPNSFKHKQNASNQVQNAQLKHKVKSAQAQQQQQQPSNNTSTTTTTSEKQQSTANVQTQTDLSLLANLIEEVVCTSQSSGSGRGGGDGTSSSFKRQSKTATAAHSRESRSPVRLKQQQLQRIPSRSLRSSQKKTTSKW